MPARNENYCQNIEQAIAELDVFVESLDSEPSRMFFKGVIGRFRSKADGKGQQQLMLVLPASLRSYIAPGFTADKLTSSWIKNLYAHADAKMVQGISRAGLRLFICVLLLEAVEQEYHEDSEFFSWAKRNVEAFRLANIHHVKLIVDAIPEDGIPDFEFFLRERDKGKNFSEITPVFFDTDEVFVRDLLRNTYDIVDRRGSHFLLSALGLTTHFTESLGFVPTDFEDFNVETFDKQLKYYAEIDNVKNRQFALSGLTKIYEYIIDNLSENQDVFTIRNGITKELLQRRGFGQEWLDGYRGVVRVHTDPVPATSKWLLIPNAEELRRASVSPTATLMDLTYERNKKLEHLMKAWLWNECEAASNAMESYRRLFPLLDTFTQQDDGMFLVTNAGITRWFATIQETAGLRVQKRYRSMARSIVNYGIGIGILKQEDSVPMLLSIRGKTPSATDDTHAANIEDLKSLANELERRSADSLLNELYYCAFVAITLTPLRIANVLALKTSDFEKHPGNIYCVLVHTKADKNGRRNVQLPSSVYRLLKSVITLTEDIRANAPESYSERLFVYEASYRNRIVPMTTDMFSKYLAETCDTIGIPKIQASDIRRRYQTEVVLQGVERNLSRLAIKPLTGHDSLATTEKYYVRDDLRNYLEATYGIEIGTPDIKGAVLPVSNEMTKEISEDDAVEYGAGFCRNPECNVPGTLTCLMCKGFVTTPDRIPEMREALENIQLRLAEASSNIHDREHLLAVKKIYAGYLAIMYSMRAEVKNNG